MRKLTIAFAALFVGCGPGAKDPAGSGTGTGTGTGAEPAAWCPVEIDGTSVTVEDTDTGAALVFVTTGDVAEVRRRVARWAAAHSAYHASMGPLPTGEEGGGGGGHEHHHHDDGGEDHEDMGEKEDMAFAPTAETMVSSAHSGARAEDIDGGARLVFTAFPDYVATIQAELREDAAQMASGACVAR
jgi:hypothetical protein